MLRLALTLARLLVAQTLRHVAVTAGLWALAVLCLLVGMTGFLVALWIWLARVLDPVAAALTIGGGGVAMALLVVLIAQNRRPPDLLASSIVEDLNAAFKDNTAMAAVWAPLIGVALLGFILGGRPKD